MITIIVSHTRRRLLSMKISLLKTSSSSQMYQTRNVLGFKGLFLSDKKSNPPFNEEIIYARLTVLIHNNKKLCLRKKLMRCYQDILIRIHLNN